MQPETLAVVAPQSQLPAHEAEHAVLDELLRCIGPRSFEHWFRNKVTLSISGEEVTIGVGSPFLLNWMQKRFREAASGAAAGVLGPAAFARFVVDARVATAQVVAAEPAPPERPSRADRATCEASSAKPPPGAGPRPGRRFADLADFIAGRSNELALAAARHVCEAPGAKFNPLFVHGGVGIGKTHLLEGIYRCLRRQFPSLQVMFLTSEAFANYFTQALRKHTLPEFRQRFRSVDVLLVDDVDFFDGKPVIQEEFLHTFKRLESLGRQIVLTADRHPRLLAKSSEELTTRFLSGMVCRIEPPDFDTRLKIVEHRGARLDGDFAPEALRFVAQRFKNNVRELEGALNCLAAWHGLTGRRVGLSTARQVLADLERDCIRVVRVSDVERAVCDFFGVQADELKSPRRHRSLSQPRMLAMFLIRKHTQAAYSEIGQHFGGRNHSTVMSAEKKVKAWLDQDAPIRVAAHTWPLGEVIETLEQQLRAS